MFFKIMPQGPEMAPPRGHMFYIGLYREKHGQIFLSETTRPSLDIRYVVLPSEPLPSLFKFIPGAKNGPTPGVTCFT